jgi:hypothetical protein
MSALEEQIKVDKQMIDIAKEDYLIALKKFNDVKNPIEKKQSDILFNFRKLKNNEIEENHSCNCCNPQYYDDAWFRPFGITMRKDADHPNDIRDRDFTWEEIEQTLSVLVEGEVLD